MGSLVSGPCSIPAYPKGDGNPPTTRYLLTLPGMGRTTHRPEQLAGINTC